MRSFGLSIAFLSLTCCTRMDQQTANENQSIKNRLEQYYADMSARDWKKYKTHFWENATITTDWQKPGDSVSRVHIITIDDFIRQTPEGPDSQPVFEEKMIAAEIKVMGNLAEAWVRYEATFGKPDSLIHWKGTDVFTLMKNKSNWKIVSLVFEGDQ